VRSALPEPPPIDPARGQRHKQRQGLHTLAPAAAAAAPAPARLTVADAQVLALAMGLPAAALPAAPRLL